MDFEPTSSGQIQTKSASGIFIEEALKTYGLISAVIMSALPFPLFSQGDISSSKNKVNFVFVSMLEHSMKIERTIIEKCLVTMNSVL